MKVSGLNMFVETSLDLDDFGIKHGTVFQPSTAGNHRPMSMERRLLRPVKFIFSRKLSDAED